MFVLQTFCSILSNGTVKPVNNHHRSNQLKSNLCTTTITGTQNLWPLLTRGRCYEVALCYEELNWNSKMTVVVSRLSLFGGRRQLRFDCTLKNAVVNG
jgi:hypothetical protein